MVAREMFDHSVKYLIEVHMACAVSHGPESQTDGQDDRKCSQVTCMCVCTTLAVSTGPSRLTIFAYLHFKIKNKKLISVVPA